MNRIIQIGDTLYLAGMRWASYMEKPGFKTEIIKDAERFNLATGWYALRNSAAIQCGFCEAAGPKVPKKLESLAAHMAEAKIEPWLGIFEISAEDDLYWYIAVRDQHAIIPNGDVIGSKATVLEAMQHHQSYNDWQYIEGDFDLLQSMLENQVATPALVKTLKASPGTRRTQLIASGLTIGIISAVGAGYWWYSEQEAAEQARIQAQKQQVLQQQGDATLAEATKLALAPLLALPLPTDFLESCREVFYSADVSENGWVMDSLNCTPETAIISRKREDGATVGLLPAGGIPSDDGEQVTQSYPGILPAPRQDLPPLLAFQDAALVLRDWSQRAGVVLTLNPPASIMPKTTTDQSGLLPGMTLLEGDKPPPPLPYLQASFSFSLRFSPFNLNFEIPGLFIKSIRTTTEGYVVEGVLYGKR